MTNAFCDQLQKMFEEHFPEKKWVVENETKPWITTDIKELILRRDSLYSSNRAESNKLRIIVVIKIKYARKQHGHLTVQKLLSSTPKKFHSTDQNILGQKHENLELANEKGEKLTANEINYHFAKISAKNPGLTSRPDLSWNISPYRPLSQTGRVKSLISMRAADQTDLSMQQWARGTV